MKYSKGMSFLHHVIRPIWSNFIGLIYAIVYAAKVFFNTNTAITYKANRTGFYRHTTLNNFKVFFKNNYRYKWDGFNEAKKGTLAHKLRGILDHDNWSIEYFTAWGDCDDCRHIMKAARIMGFKAYRIGMIGKTLTSYHYDVIIERENEHGEKYVTLFNYGNMIDAPTITNALKQMTDMFGWASLFQYDSMKYWICKF